jgi:dihydrofolate synthase / folylpolyglutamate synthase
MDVALVCTPPHLLKLEERFQFCGRICSENELVELIDCVLPVSHRVEQQGLGKPTFFELTTAMGMLYFARQTCDSVVMEVGLGGRLDSTNVCLPKLTLITSISLDHQAQLGSTIAEIAVEKAGIIKPRISVISTARHPDACKVIQATAQTCHSELLLLDRDFFVQWRPTRNLAIVDRSSDESAGVAEVTYSSTAESGEFIFGNAPWTLSVLGKHQADNLAGAITALNWLATRAHWSLDPAKTRQAIANSHVPGRLQVVGSQPICIIDTAHNPASVSAGLQAIQDHYGKIPLTVVFASSRDKEYRAMLQLILPQCAAIYCTAFLKNPRAVSPEDLVSAAREVAAELSSPANQITLGECNKLNEKIFLVDAPGSAWQAALAACPTNGLVLAIGSFFLAAELMEISR